VFFFNGFYPGKTYFLSAYITTYTGISYGNEITFKTFANLPIVITSAPSSVTSTSVTTGGNITSDGGSSINSRGICYSKTVNPTTADSKTTDTGTTGIFTSLITGLTPGTTYYVRAYATNSAGTSYGNEVSFTATAYLPVVTTTAASSVTNTTASSGGNVTSDGGGAITARGVCWGTTTGLTIDGSKTTDAGATGIFTSSITGLSAGTTYYVRA